MRHSPLIFSLIVAVVALTAGCRLRPREVLSQKQMTEVLCDLHRTDGILQIAGMNYGYDDEVACYYAGVLAKHGVTQAQFDSSLVWYTANPKKFEHIYSRVTARLTADADAFKQTEMPEGKPLSEYSSGGRPAPAAFKPRPIPLDSLLLQAAEGLSLPAVVFSPQALPENTLFIYREETE